MSDKFLYNMRDIHTFSGMHTEKSTSDSCQINGNKVVSYNFSIDFESNESQNKSLHGKYNCI